jgi:hypothetical protein
MFDSFSSAVRRSLETEAANSVGVSQRRQRDSYIRAPITVAGLSFYSAMAGQTKKCYILKVCVSL